MAYVEEKEATRLGSLRRYVEFLRVVGVGEGDGAGVLAFHRCMKRPLIDVERDLVRLNVQAGEGGYGDDIDSSGGLWASGGDGFVVHRHGVVDVCVSKAREAAFHGCCTHAHRVAFTFVAQRRQPRGEIRLGTRGGDIEGALEGGSLFELALGLLRAIGHGDLHHVDALDNCINIKAVSTDGKAGKRKNQDCCNDTLLHDTPFRVSLPW